LSRLVLTRVLTFALGAMVVALAPACSKKKNQGAAPHAVAEGGEGGQRSEGGDGPGAGAAGDDSAPGGQGGENTGGASGESTGGSGMGATGGLGGTGGTPPGTSCAAPCEHDFCLLTSDLCNGPEAHDCVGSHGDTYCSPSCSSDADCAGGPLDLVCLSSCPGEIADAPVSGRCWSREDADALLSGLCAAGGVGGGGGAGGMGTSGAGSGVGATGGQSGNGANGGRGGRGGVGGASGAGGAGGTSGAGGTGAGGSGGGTGGGSSGSAGAPAVCTNGNERCESGDFDRCVDGDWDAIETCPSGCYDDQTCACTPGVGPRCRGNEPLVCTQDGFWDPAEPCDGSCVGGACCERICTFLFCDVFYGCTCYSWITECSNPVPRCVPGERRCNGTEVEECQGDRTWQVIEECPFVCTGEGICGGDCEPDAVRCRPGSVDVREVCDDEGAWQQQSVCQFACVGGACTGSCKPGTGRCTSFDGAQVCNADGSYDAPSACSLLCLGGACADDQPCGSVGPCTIYYEEDFDAGCPSGWTLGGDWQCGVPSGAGPGAALSGANVLATQLGGNYNTNQSYTVAMAASPPIDLTAASQPVLGFWAWVDTEGSTFDGFNVKVTSDAGSTYVRPLAVDPAYPLTIDGQKAWGGHRGTFGFEQYMVDLSAYVGDVIQVALSFRSDAVVVYPGVYVDNVMVFDASLVPTSVSSPAVPRCTVSQSRCVGNVSQTCSANATWQTTDVCPFICSGTGSCTGECSPGTFRCDPNQPDVRQACDDTATWLDQMTCSDGCSSGTCNGQYLVEGFELGCPPIGWTLSGDWQCGVPTSGPNAAATGVNVIATQLAGNYSANQTYAGCAAELPPIDLSAAIDPLLRFVAYVDTEGSSYDGFNLKASTDGGSTFQPISAVTPAYGLTVGGESAWGGHQQSLGYQDFEADLSAFVGETVILRFAFRSDFTVQYPGVYVDDVSVIERGLDPLAITTVTLPDAYSNNTYDATLTKTGGSSVSLWEIVGGTNIAWMTIDPATGALGGTPSASEIGPASVTIRVSEPYFPSNSDELTFAFGVIGVVYATSFEGACPNGWTLGGDWECGVPSAVGPSVAYSGSQCIATQIDANYNANQAYATATATSPVIDLTSTVAPSLEFRMWLNSESGFDGLNLKLSTDGANYSLISNVSPAYDQTIAGETVWAGDKSAAGWVRYTVSLAAYAGQNIRLRFAFRSDTIIQRPGAYIDAITIVD